MEICKILLQTRKEKGYTQDYVAESVGISRRSLGYYETGERTPNADILMKLCALYEIPITMMVESDIVGKDSVQKEEQNSVLVDKIDQYLKHENEKKESFSRGLLITLAAISLCIVVLVLAANTIRFLLMGMYGYTFSKATAEMWTSFFNAMIQFVNDPNVVLVPVFSIVIISTLALGWAIYFFIKYGIKKKRK